MKSPLLFHWSQLSPSRLPSYLISGINVALGMSFVGAASFLLGGAGWALGAALGAIVTSMPDQVTRPENKLREVLPGTFLGAAMFLASTLSHPHIWLSAATIVVGSFIAALPQAWGKRGAPLSVSMLFSLVIPLAAPAHGRIDFAFLETALFIGGGLLYAGFTSTTARWLDPRYRTLAVADCTQALARLMRLQARAMNEGTEPAAAPAVVSKLVLEQTTWADRLQTARDLVFNTLEKPRDRQLAALLFTLIEVRDQLLSCQLDIDLMMSSRVGREAVPALTAMLEAAASHCEVLTVQLRHGDLVTAETPRTEVVAAEAVAAVAAASEAAILGAARPPSESAPRPTLMQLLAARIPRYVKPWSPPENEREPMVVSVVRDRHHLLLHAVQSMSATLSDPTAKPPLSEGELQLFTTPKEWRWAFLKERLRWRSPILRFALRSALAMGVAFAVAENMPWASHKQWILISVAVVLRSNYAQTAERRKLRLVGTAIGCVITAVLLAVTQDKPIVFLAMIVAAGTAHAFPLINYTVTSTAATLLGLLQTHLIAPEAGIVVWERMVDTVLGIALAWAASFVFPSWERHQVPGLLRRVLAAQARYVELTLRQYRQPAVAIDWRLARREVYDALGALTLGIQRMQSEPRQVRLSVAAASHLLAHAHELMAHMAAVNMLLNLRRENLDPGAADAAIDRASSSLAAILASPTADNAQALGSFAPRQPPEAALPLLPPGSAGDLTPWLLRRLSLAEQEARMLVSYSVPVRNAAMSPAP